MNKHQALNILALLHEGIDGLAGCEYDYDSHIASLENVVRLQEFVKRLPDNYLTIIQEVSEHFMPALINDDLTGLSDDDEAALKKFLANSTQLDGWEFRHFSHDNDSFPEFTTCDITGLYSNCVTIKLVFKEM
jgi:hypothetical protein